MSHASAIVTSSLRSVRGSLAVRMDSLCTGGDCNSFNTYLFRIYSQGMDQSKPSIDQYILWATAGHLNRQTMQLERSTRMTGWLRPATVRVANDRIHWEWGDGLPPSGCEPGPGLVKDFVAISRDGANSVEEYASRWGILGACEHLDPAGARIAPPDSPDTVRRLGDVQRLWFVGHDCSEPVDLWMTLSKQVRAVLSISARLHQASKRNSLDTEANREDWLKLEPYVKGASSWFSRINFEDVFGPDREPPGPPPDIELQRMVLGEVLSQLLEASRLRLSFSWRSALPEAHIGAAGFFSAVVVQLAAIVSREEAPLFCMSCGQMYLPKRKPTEGDSNYCPACNKDGKASKRDWARRNRAKASS